MHDNLPLAPVYQEIKRDILSPYQNNLADDIGVKVGDENLCLMMEDKNRYICNYQTLKLYPEKGLKLTRIHRVLRFKQSTRLKPYINLKTKLRQGASSKFEENLSS